MFCQILDKEDFFIWEHILRLFLITPDAIQMPAIFRSFPHGGSFNDSQAAERSVKKKGARFPPQSNHLSTEKAKEASKRLRRRCPNHVLRQLLGTHPPPCHQNVTHKAKRLSLSEKHPKAFFNGRSCQDSLNLSKRC